MLGIIMAGGQGTRLMPLTATRPKPMVEVLGRPVIDFVKDAMVEANINELVVTTGYRGEQLQAHVESWTDPSRGITGRINQEATPMGTAGSVGLLRDLISSTCVVGSGDAVASFDIASLLKAHRESGAKVTMALWEVEDPSEFGIVGLSETRHGEVDGDLRQGFIRRFLEKPSPTEAFSNVINAGLYILEPDVFDHVPLGEKFDFSKQLFPRLLELDWPMYAQTIDGVWFDVGQPFELLNAQSTLIERYEHLPFVYPEGFSEHNGVLQSDDVSSQGELEASVIGPGCTIDERAVIASSLLMAGCHVGKGAVVLHSVLGERVKIPEGCTVNRCVVGDDVELEAGAIYADEKIGLSS